MLNLDGARRLRDLQHQVAQEVVRGGAAWSAGTWSTSRASQALYSITKVPLVTTLEEYKNVWLFCLSMLWGLDITSLQLGDRAAEAAFALAEAVVAPLQDARMASEEDHAEEEEPALRLAWEESLQPLPREFSHILTKVNKREGPLQVKTFLEKIPIFQELPRTAPINNHRKDGMSRQDRALKVQQQQLLHLARIQTYLYIGVQEEAGKEELLQLMQQCFQLTMEYAQKTEDQRKENSMPGCVPMEQAPLFQKEDIQLASLNRSIQGKGQTSGFQPFRYNDSQSFSIIPIHSPSLRPGKGQYRFRAYGKGYGRPFGYGSRGYGYGSQPRGTDTLYITNHTSHPPPSVFNYGSGGGARPGKGKSGSSMFPSQNGGSNPLLHQAKAADEMVARAWKPSSDKFGGPWCAFTSLAPCALFKSLHKKPLPNSSCSSNFGGIPFHRSSKISFNGGGKTPYALVCDRKNGGRKKESQIHFRLSTTQSIPNSPPLQNGSLGYHFPSPEEKHVGGEDRFKKCILSLGIRRQIKAISLPPSRGKHLPISRGLFWPKQFASPLDPINENLSKTLEDQGDHMFHILGRYSSNWSKPTVSPKGSQFHDQIPPRFWNGNQPGEEHFGTPTKDKTFGLPDKFCHRIPRGTKRKIKNHKEGIRKILNSSFNDIKKSCFHFGCNQIISPKYALLKGFYRPNVTISKNSSKSGVGFSIPNPTQSPISGERGQRSLTKLDREKIFGSKPSKNPPFRFITTQLGGGRHSRWHHSSGILEGSGGASYQRKGANSCYTNSQKFGKKGGGGPPMCRQFSHILLSYKGGGRTPHLNAILRPFLTWCMDAQVILQVSLVRSKDCLADGPSRWGVDKGDYTLHAHLFKLLEQQMHPWVQPVVDCFASPGNKKYPQFISRFPHWEAVAVDSLNCPLERFSHIYANPPWNLIFQFLNRLRENKHLTCMLIVPYWVGATWYPLLVKMQIPKSQAFFIPPCKGMFTNCLNISMPAPKWPLLCVALSGKFWKPNRSHLRVSKFIWTA